MTSIFAAALLLVGIGFANARPIHIASTGDDAARGESPESAVRTLTRAAELAEPGDELLLRRGDRWQEVLRLEDDEVRIGSYGTGPLPIISGANRLPAFESTGAPSEVRTIPWNRMIG